MNYANLPIFLSFCLSLIIPINCEISNYSFPDGFLFGAATASYQIEGGWNASGKGENIWDHASHATPEHIRDRSTGDIAADSYHKYKDDIELLKNLGVDFYRFSISWSRIMPNGKPDHVNPDGIRYYNSLIDELLANNIEPYVTMYHWDLPQPLQDEGGWTNPKLVEYFGDYATTLFDKFGDRVKKWITFNEIKLICEFGYGSGSYAPFVHKPGIGCYQCAHNVLLAHGRTYTIYNREFRSAQKGEVGITIESFWYEPNNNDVESDQEASELAMLMNYGWFVNPLIHGDYPEVMRTKIKSRSLSEGFNESRLPEFTQEEIAMLKGSFDFLGLNHYTTYKCNFVSDAQFEHPSQEGDVGVEMHQEKSWEGSSAYWLKVVPWGFRKLLVWIKNHYGNPRIIITENGFADKGGVQDYGRARYHKLYLNEVLKAIHEDGCNIFGYTAWSLIDTFEWIEGYTLSFGLHYVNFSDPNRPRTPKLSSYVYKHIVATRHIDWKYYPSLPSKNEGYNKNVLFLIVIINCIIFSLNYL